MANFVFQQVHTMVYQISWLGGFQNLRCGYPRAPSEKFRSVRCWDFMLREVCFGLKIKKFGCRFESLVSPYFFLRWKNNDSMLHPKFLASLKRKKCGHAKKWGFWYFICKTRFQKLVLHFKDDPPVPPLESWQRIFFWNMRGKILRGVRGECFSFFISIAMWTFQKIYEMFLKCPHFLRYTEGGLDILTS